MKKHYSVLYQSVVLGLIVLISKVIETFLPFTMPSSVIGLILLFLALTFKVIKLEHVEKAGTALVDNIGLFFVPAGISVMNSFGILKAHFILNILLIFISTLILLVATGWMTQVLMAVNPVTLVTTVKQYFAKKKPSVQNRLKTSDSYWNN